MEKLNGKKTYTGIAALLALIIKYTFDIEIPIEQIDLVVNNGLLLYGSVMGIYGRIHAGLKLKKQ